MIGHGDFVGRRMKTALYIPPIGTRRAMPSPVRKRVVAHNPQRPHKNGNDSTSPYLYNNRLR